MTMGKIRITESDIKKITKAVVNEVLGKLYEPDTLTRQTDQDFLNNSQTIQIISQILNRGGWEWANLIDNGEEEIGLIISPIADKAKREIAEIGSAISERANVRVRPVPYHGSEVDPKAKFKDNPYTGIWILYIKRKDSGEYGQMRKSQEAEYDKEWKQEAGSEPTQYTPAGLK